MAGKIGEDDRPKGSQFKVQTLRNGHIFSFFIFMWFYFSLYIKTSKWPSSTLTSRGRFMLEAKEIYREAMLPADRNKLVRIVARIARKGTPILVGFANNRYLPFVYSWLCNTRNMGVQDTVLIITADEETENAIKRKRPDLAVVTLSGINIKGDHDHQSPGYTEITVKRTQVIYFLLHLNVAVLLFEFDCLWMRNPIPEVTQYSEYDLVVTEILSSEMVASGFLYMTPTEHMRVFWEALTGQMTELNVYVKTLPHNTRVAEIHNDQHYLSTLIDQNYANIRVKKLSFVTFPDGQWYNRPAAQRDLTNVFILNNNFIVGNQNKINRAKQFGHWFLKDDESCDIEQVNKIVK